MAKVFLVWNETMTECVGFTDAADAKFASTGDSGGMPYSSLADSFRDLYAEDAEDEELTMVEIDL